MDGLAVTVKLNGANSVLTQLASAVVPTELGFASARLAWCRLAKDCHGAVPVRDSGSTRFCLLMARVNCCAGPAKNAPSPILVLWLVSSNASFDYCCCMCSLYFWFNNPYTREALSCSCFSRFSLRSHMTPAKTGSGLRAQPVRSTLVDKQACLFAYCISQRRMRVWLVRRGCAATRTC